jgi:hypothetical protein
VIRKGETFRRARSHGSEPVDEGDQVFRSLCSRLTYANVMSTLAVFIALGGSSYAAVKISGKDLKNRSVPGTKLKRNSLTGTEIRESKLGRVPRAAYADRLSDAATQQLLVKCPAGTFPMAGTCIEETARRPAAYGSAVLECLDVGTPQGPGRRLPTHGEMQAALSRVTLSPGGELTSDVYPSSRYPGELDVLYVTSQGGAVALTVDRGEGAKSFRCAADPIN